MNREVNTHLKQIIRNLDEASKVFRPFTKADYQGYAGASSNAMMYEGPMSREVAEEVTIIYDPTPDEDGSKGGTLDVYGITKEWEDWGYVKTGVPDIQAAIRLAANVVRVLEDTGLKWDSKQLKGFEKIV